MSSKITTTSDKIRGWCLGTLIGVIIVSVASNLISDSIPNPINYVIRWFTGKEEQRAELAPQPRLKLLTVDDEIISPGAVLPTKWIEGDKIVSNWLLVNCHIKNTGEADTGPLRIFYYLDSRLPKPEISTKSSEVGFGHEIPGGVLVAPDDGNLRPGWTFFDGLGITFGNSIEKPQPGDYKFLLKIRNSDGTMLHEGFYKIRIN